MSMRSMTVVLAVLVLAVGLRAEDAAPNSLTEAEKAAGFRLLFDGKSTDGWRGYKRQDVPAGWEVVDGALTFSPEKAKATKGGRGDIITTEQFSAFELLIDWKVAPGANSGIMYHVQETAGAPYMTGPEMQVLDNTKHPDGKNPKTSAGSLYAMVAPEKDVTKPAGEWNQARLIIYPDGSAEHWLNGVKLLEYKKGSAEWDKLVASSKFKNWKEFGKPTTGHIDLQDHGDSVAFRNIKIRVITTETPK